MSIFFRIINYESFFHDLIEDLKEKYLLDNTVNIHFFRSMFNNIINLLYKLTNQKIRDGPK